MQPVDVLGRIDAKQDLLLVDAVGQRQLHEDRMDIGIGVESIDDRFDLLLGRRRR